MSVRQLKFMRPRQGNAITQLRFLSQVYETREKMQINLSSLRIVLKTNSNYTTRKQHIMMSTSASQASTSQAFDKALEVSKCASVVSVEASEFLGEHWTDVVQAVVAISGACQGVAADVLYNAILLEEYLPGIPEDAVLKAAIAILISVAKHAGFYKEIHQAARVRVQNDFAHNDTANLTPTKKKLLMTVLYAKYLCEGLQKEGAVPQTE